MAAPPIQSIRWEVPSLSTTSMEAALHYRDGIAALVSGVATAERLLSAAIALDPAFMLARVGVAVCDVAAGAPYRPPEMPEMEDGRVGRAERQHAEIVETAFCGDGRHADDLRREHLLEFPGDLLIVWLPALRRTP